MKKLNKGKLFYNVKASYNELALRFVADQQAQIDEMNRCIDNIMLTLLDYDSVTVKHSDDSRIELIHRVIGDYKKALLETESGREFLAKYDIKMYKDNKPK